MTTELQAEMPFYESAEDATHSAILASRLPLKEVAAVLWPALKTDSAHARLRGSLNTDRPEKLTADEHIFIANHCQQFHFLHYTAQQCHHSQPVPVDPDDEKAELQKQFIRSVTELRQLAGRIGA